MTFLPAVPVALPLLAAALLSALNHRIPRRASSLCGQAVTLATFFACAELFRASLSGTLVYWFGGWVPRKGAALGICFAIDPAGAGLAALACVLVFCSFVFAFRYFDSVGTLFHVLLLVFLAALCGFALTGDLFNLFVFFELMSAAAFGLCGYKTEDPASVQGAFNFAATNTVAAYFILSGVGLLYARTGALNLAQIGRALDSGGADALVIGAFTFISCGYLVKAAVVPFHFWLADAHAVAPSPVCVLFSGVMVELGLYAVARVYWTVFAGPLGARASSLSEIFLAIGAGTAVLGAGMCFSQRNLKRLLAFSTISHMGVMVIGFGLLSDVGLAGTALYVAGHAGAKGGLFLFAGILLHRCRSVDELELHGKLGHLGPAALGMLAGAAALAGTALSGIGAGLHLITQGGNAAGHPWIRWVTLVSGVLTSGALVRFIGGTFGGLGPDPRTEPEQGKIDEQPETAPGPEKTPFSMWVPASCLVLFGLLAGALPGVQSGAGAAAARFINHAGYERRVLEGVAFPSPPAPLITQTDGIDPLLAIAGALALGLGWLLWDGGRRGAESFAARLQWVRAAHSGHVGDYVTWLTVGTAAVGLVSLLLLRQL